MGILKFVPIGVLMAAALGAAICGCGSGAATVPSGTTPAIPTITSLSPTSSTAGGAAFTLTVFGSNFVSSSVVRWNGSDRPTTLVSSSQLNAQISASDIVATGTATVTVFNPGQSGGTSNASKFEINTPPIHPTPTINSLDPSCSPVGGQAFTSYVLGSNFVASSVVRWNGTDRHTEFVNSNEIYAEIPASDIAAAGTATVTVFNPAPGGGSSNASTLNMVAGGVYPQSVALDPTGKFAYVANEGCLDAFAGNVSMYKTDPTTGVLTSIGSPVAADFYPHSVTVDPSGKFAYVANAGDPDTGVGTSVSMYTINATTGALASIGAIGAVTNFSSPWSVAVDLTSPSFCTTASERVYITAMSCELGLGGLRGLQATGAGGL